MVIPSYTELPFLKVGASNLTKARNFGTSFKMNPSKLTKARNNLCLRFKFTTLLEVEFSIFTKIEVATSRGFLRILS